MKKSRVVLFVALAILVTGVCGYGVYNISRGILMTDKAKEAANCADSSAVPTEHIVAISGGKLSAYKLETRLCDTLTIVNSDDQLRLMAFGVHEKHQTYSGVTEETLKPGERMTVTLEKAGTFTFHDHLHDEVKGTFTVR
jgi:plastocyanin